MSSEDGHQNQLSVVIAELPTEADNHSPMNDRGLLMPVVHQQCTDSSVQKSPVHNELLQTGQTPPKNDSYGVRTPSPLSAMIEENSNVAPQRQVHFRHDDIQETKVETPKRHPSGYQIPKPISILATYKPDAVPQRTSLSAHQRPNGNELFQPAPQYHASSPQIPKPISFAAKYKAGEYQQHTASLASPRLGQSSYNQFLPIEQDVPRYNAYGVRIPRPISFAARYDADRQRTTRFAPQQSMQVTQNVLYQPAPQHDTYGHQLSRPISSAPKHMADSNGHVAPLASRWDEYETTIKELLKQRWNLEGAKNVKKTAQAEMYKSIHLMNTEESISETSNKLGRCFDRVCSADEQIEKIQSLINFSQRKKDILQQQKEIASRLERLEFH